MKTKIRKFAVAGMVLSSLFAAPMIAQAYAQPQAKLDTCLQKAKSAKDKELARSECYWKHNETWLR